jgi:hypothetical protein
MQDSLRLTFGPLCSPWLSTALFFEFEGVLNRPGQRLATDMSKQDVVGFLADLASAAEAVDVRFM